MNITRTTIEPLITQLQLSVTPEDYKPTFDNRIKKAIKEVSLKGFRPGQVPRGMVLQMFGDELLAESLQDFVWKSMEDYVSTNDIKILGSPEFVVDEDKKVVISHKELTDAEFTFQLAMIPEFDIKFTQDQVLTKYKIEVTPDMIDDAMVAARKQFGKYETCETVTENGYIIIIATYENCGEPKEASILTKWIKDEALLAKVMAAKAGDEFVIENVYEAFEKSVKETNQFILNKAGDKEIELENKTVTITLKESKDLVLAEVNEDFFKTIFPNVEINNETELNEYFKTDYEKYFEERTNGQLNHDISHYLMDNIQVDLTDNYIKLLITKDKETNKAPEITQSIRDEVRWVIIENKIMMEDGITVEYDEVVQSAMAAYKRNAPQNENYTDEMLMASIDSFFKDKKENYKKEYDNVMNNKFLAAVLKRANVVEKTITLDEFKAVLKEHEHHH